MVGVVISQNYLGDAGGTSYIQEHAVPYAYDVGGSWNSSNFILIDQEVVTASQYGIALSAVNFSLINLPHVNFSIDPLASEGQLPGNDSRSTLSTGALIWINASALMTPLIDMFNITSSLKPGVYLQRSIGEAFHLPVNGAFSFSFGTFSESMNLSPGMVATNFTAISQEVPCTGYFDFATNASPDFLQILAHYGVSYYVLCIWGNSPAPRVEGLVLPAYYLGMQPTVFFVKFEDSEINVDNLPLTLKSMETIATGIFFSHSDQYTAISNTLAQEGQTSVLKSISLFIIICIFFHWFFTSTAENRLRPITQDILYGNSRKRILASFVLTEMTLALIGTICANIFGLLLGFFGFAVDGWNTPFYYSFLR